MTTISRDPAESDVMWLESVAAAGAVDPQRIDRHARARRILKWCAVALCLSPIAGGWLVDRCPIRFRFAEAAKIISSWQTADPVPDVLVLGSSRLLWGIDTSRLITRTKQLLAPAPPVIFNGATFGGEPITLNFVSKKLLEARGIAPRMVVVEISPDTLGRDNLQFNWPITRQMTAADLLRYGPDIIWFHDGISRLLSSRVTPFYRHGSELLAWLTEPVRQRTGISPAEKIFDVAAAQQQANDFMLSNDWPRRVQRFEKHLRHYELRGATSQAFEEMIARFHTLGCKIVLVQPPLTTNHHALFSSHVRAQFEPFLQHLREAYGCDFVDLAADVPDDGFRDGDHVNERGRPRLTDLLAEKAIAPAWRNLSAGQAATALR